METSVEIPARGEPMKASWGESVANALNRLNVSGSSNMLVSEDVSGFSFSSLPQNRRTKTSQAKYWSYSETDDENDVTTGHWSNCVMQIGYRAGITFENGFDVQGGITGSHDCYARVDLSSHLVTEVVTDDEVNEVNDIVSLFGAFAELANNVLYIYVGRVSDGVLVDSVNSIPVAYIYS